jgi:peptidoglycan/xylan/chitin deacetylase (PgdA/CDA1 family)
VQARQPQGRPQLPAEPLRTFAALLIAGALLAPVASAQPVVSLTFDDEFADQVPARDELAARGMHATFFVNSGTVGAPGRLTWEQLQSFAAAGDEIGGHTIDHVNLKRAPDARHQVCDDRAALVAHGFDPVSFAYPYGAFDRGIQALVRSCGYESARTTLQIGPAETIPPRDPYAVAMAPAVRSTTTLADLQRYVNAAHGSGWVVLLFHHVCDGCDSYAIDPGTLTAFLDWLAPRATIRTVHDVVASYRAPATAASVAAPRGGVPIAAGAGYAAWTAGGRLRLRAGTARTLPAISPSSVAVGPGPTVVWSRCRTCRLLAFAHGRTHAVPTGGPASLPALAGHRLYFVRGRTILSQTLAGRNRRVVARAYAPPTSLAASGSLVAWTTGPSLFVHANGRTTKLDSRRVTTLRSASFAGTTLGYLAENALRTLPFGKDGEPLSAAAQQVTLPARTTAAVLTSPRSALTATARSVTDVSWR